MRNPGHSRTCRRCGAAVHEKYCGNCGEVFAVKRITMRTLLHDVFHFFTHLDKGFGFTVKQLLVSPGHMQRCYIEGDRSRYQKPFSLFFICATIDAVLRYWINSLLIRYFQTGSEAEANFFHQYFVITHILMLPLYVLITWVIFYNTKYNYAETGILVLYTVSSFFLIVAFLYLPRLIWHRYDSTWVELVTVAVYNSVTFINFYNKQNKWVILVKSLVTAASIFFIANYVEDFISDWLSH